MNKIFKSLYKMLIRMEENKATWALFILVYSCLSLEKVSYFRTIIHTDADERTGKSLQNTNGVYFWVIG